MRHYASLTGPLLGLYYPLPLEGDHEQWALALNESKLARLWCSIYTEGEVDRQITKYGGAKLPSRLAG